MIAKLLKKIFVTTIPVFCVCIIVPPEVSAIENQKESLIVEKSSNDIQQKQHTDNVLQIKIDSLVNELKVYSDQSKKQEKEIESNFWLFIALTTVSFLLGGFALFKAFDYSKDQNGKKLADRINHHRNELDQLKSILDQQKRINNTNSTQYDQITKNHIFEQFNNLNVRISEIERRLKGINKTELGEHNEEPAYGKDIIAKESYFGNIIHNGNGFFESEIDSTNSNVQFKAFVKGNKAEFVPYDINILKYNDNLDEAIEYDRESVSLRMAKKFSVKSNGIAIYKNNKWEIESKALIKLE